MDNYEKLLGMKFSELYQLYINKALRKNRTKDEVDLTLLWLTDYTKDDFLKHLEMGTTLRDFLVEAPMNQNAYLITGVVCGIRVENIEDPTIQKIRYMDKLIDELAKGKALEKILRK